MATREVIVTLKDLRAALSMAENLVNAAHEALQELPDTRIRVREWVGAALDRGPVPIMTADRCLTTAAPRRRKRTADAAKSHS